MEMDGLIVDYDGEKNIVLYQGMNEYPIGGMIAEYARLHPSNLKEIILNYQLINSDVSDESISEFFPWFIDEISERYGIVTAIMITFEFLDIVTSMLKKDHEYEKEWYKEITEEDSIGRYIFEGSGFNSTGFLTNKQLLLSAYYWWTSVYVTFKHCFLMLVSDKEYEDKQIDAFFSMFTKNIDFQHIDFKIANFEGTFHSLYTIKSSMSLLLFEVAHCLDRNIQFKQCVNCGAYFVPKGRNDAIYCSYPSPQNPKKICKDIGAQITRANKEKNDLYTKEYRRIYMRYKMITLRHPENKEAKIKLERLISEAKIWRKRMKDGLVTSEEFFKWLGEF